MTKEVRTDIKQKLENSFDRLQDLDIKPTLNNQEKLLQTLYDLREAYELLEGDENGRTAPDSEGQNSD